MLKGVLNPATKRARRFIKNSVNFDPDRIVSIDQQVQRSIVNQYALSRQAGVVPYSDIKDAGFRVYSQFEEDGIILYVLSMIGFKTRRVVEMCCGDGTECMATNFILNHGFEGFLFDGNEGGFVPPRLSSLEKRLLALPALSDLRLDNGRERQRSAQGLRGGG